MDGYKGKETTGVILLNLGGPDSLDAVRPFLYNLFSDREIIKLGPSFLQKPLAWLISALRSKKSAKMYSLIGGKSPLLEITTAQAKALEEALNQNTEHRTQSTENPPLPPFDKGGMGGFFNSSLYFKVYIGMRYWHPFIEDTVNRMISDGIKHIVVLSLYPHYSKTTTGSAVSEFKRAVEKFKVQSSKFKVQYIEQWYDFPPYIEAVAGLISKGLAEFDSKDVDILYSAHSLPESFINKGDPYLEHIKATISAVNSSLVTRHSLLGNWHLSFQSKTGPVKWLEPATGETIIRLANEGRKNILIVPISFVSDSVETSYEIDILYKGLAERHGINLRSCGCLNVSEKFIEAMKELVMREIE
ncbi:MAG: ferrochelatase [Nitrospirae bacterium]|nr:ferrochelatase [Nitrospirota bacterium]